MNHSVGTWSLCIGFWRGVSVRLHIAFPLLALSVLFLATQANYFDLDLAVPALGVLLGSVALHELVRAITARRVGGQVNSFVLAPMGGSSKLHLPADPTAHLITALSGPLVYFVMMVLAGCGLALGGDREVLRLLISPCNPEIQVTKLGMWTSQIELLSQLVVWISWCLLLVDLLPIDPCAGAELMRGVLWPLVGRDSARTATYHVALGGALFCALLALMVPRSPLEEAAIPPWLPLAFVSVFLLFGGMRSFHDRRYDIGLAIDQYDSDDEEWLTSEWIEEDREAVLVEHLQDKQQEALDRKRREQEASEDARVDAILARLHGSSLEKLSEEERAILKRASRRYQQRRKLSEDSSV